MISLFAEDIEMPPIQTSEIEAWIKKTAKLENKKCGNINIIFCSDEYLLKINQEHLNHDYYTDIITFDYGNGEKISGDLFISIDRTNDNAKQNNLNTIDELHRVIIHGSLHLIGYGDKSPEEKKLMTSKEDYYISLR